MSYGVIATKLQKLQNRAARILTSSSYDANVDDLFFRLDWQKLNLQRELKTATMVYKSLNGLAPDYLKSMFTDRSATSTYSLRNCEGKLALPLPRTNFLKNSFSYSGAVLWNSLPTKYKHLLVLNPAVGDSFLIMINLITRYSWKQALCYCFVVIRFN